MNQFQLEVCTSLQNLQIPANLRGYEYIKCALDFIHTDNTETHKMMNLYGKIAEKYGSTGSRIERGIRHAIKNIRASKEDKNKIIGRPDDLPNAEFLATLHEAIILRMAGETEQDESRSLRQA